MAVLNMKLTHTMQVTRDHAPENGSGGLLTVHEGDVMAVTNKGQIGWTFGKVLLDKKGNKFFE